MVSINSKPLLRVTDSKKVESLCSKLKEEIIPVMEQLDHQVSVLYNLQKQKEAIKEKYWVDIRRVLLDQGYIDQLEVSLSIRDGVVYLDYLSENIEFVRKSLKHLFDDTLL